MKEIAIVASLTETIIFSTYSKIFQAQKIVPEKKSPISYVAKIASNINLSEKCQREAISILKRAQTNVNFGGKSPVSLAAAALYAACRSLGENITQPEIADSAKVTTVTIRNNFKSFLKHKIIS